MKSILICITGAVAAVALPNYIMIIRKHIRVNVTVMISKNATKFVTPYSLSIYSGSEVFTDTYDFSEKIIVPHIRHTETADIVLVMPATANIIGKVAHGICDDLISTSILASQSPVLFVPSMNERMWFSKPMQHNVQRIKEYWYHIVEPEMGIEVGDASESFGAMASLKTILSLLKKYLEI